MNPFLIFILSLIGFLISIYIFRTKKSNKPFVCPITEGGCEQVVKSKYSKILGIPNEVIGILFYASIMIVSLLYLFAVIEEIFSLITFYNAQLIITGISAIFSLFLLGIQIFKLKKYCEWCIASTIASVLIFIFSF